MTQTVELKEFEERSDYIEESDLELWNVSNPHFENIQRELLGVGARLIVGPRGTGKTHQMKIAYNKCVKDPNRPIAIFISFNKYYRLEPFLTKAPNAIQIFHTWVLCKVLLGCYAYLKESKTENFQLSESEKASISETKLKEFEQKAESPFSHELKSDELISKLSVSMVISIIDNMINRLNKKRAVLMLDDAALTLTPDYLRKKH